MIDIHHHLLYGVDDGSPDLETSLKMAEMAAADGITHVVCTPHAIDRYPFRPAVNAERLAALREQVGGKLTLGMGCDFHLSYDNIEDALKTPRKYTINARNYLLVEFEDLMIPKTTGETFHELSVAGARPIITHPERNLTLQKHPERMEEWLANGCLVQITSNSLTGRFGKTAQTLGWQFIAKNWAHFIATDAHNLDSRPPIMSEAYELIAKRHGQETAERLCVTNPRAAFEGTALPEAPSPSFEHLQEPSASASFLGRLFGRRS
jgi:protein-tyrosine phosphatase